MKISIKAARVNADLTQSEAAKKIKVSENTLRAWESGKTTPRAEKMPDICSTYGCTYNDLRF